MLIPIVCPDSGSSSWVVLAGILSLWLVRPLFVLSALFALFVVSSLIPHRPIQRIFRRGTVALALIYLVGFFPPTISIAETALKQAIPEDSGATADAVVILGRGRRLNPSRAEVAAHLWQEQRAPLIFASGIHDAPKLLSMLHNTGIPDQSLQGEGCSRTTYENAEFTSNLLKPQGIRRILLVTDGPHMLRSLLTFRGFGFEVIPFPSTSLQSLDRTSRTKLVLREYMGLVSYGLLGRFSAHASSAPVSSVVRETTVQQTTFQETGKPQATMGSV